MTLTEAVPMAEGSQMSLAPKQKASETHAWGPGPTEALEGAGNKSQTDPLPRVLNLTKTCWDSGRPGTARKLKDKLHNSLFVRF